MASDHQAPAVMAAPGVNPNDGHEHFWSPRNIIAFAITAAFIVYSFMPYVVGTIQDGRAGDLIISNGKVIETIVVLIIGFFFGTTVNAARREARQENQANAIAAGGAAGAADNTLKVEPPFTIRAEEPVHGQEADALRGADDPAGLPAAPRVPPRDDGPPE